ncbi:hemerythrin domain-containing protein [Geomonas azotofigens]|uniref:hemerythrin domain-containing protein n=1 Tax=Geomonas azotofigens TaxID=2843196 RepID=UPI001C1043B9|nr:hemerythrin domain-containing protein [Geomonas azotofigens]MBU5613019.1 hemerythrin domain-containing protein [Geomonas azotofigens]
MKQDITQRLKDEHQLILRMLALLERNARLTEEGSFKDYQFYLDGVDFIRNYADRFHHAKEEDVLFEALVENGMPRDNSPVAAMLMEHDLGRAYVKAMEEAATKALNGEAGQEEAIVANARGYLDLLREHIAKEDDILYPLAERILPEGVRHGITAGYQKAEERSEAGFEEHYRKVVEKYEKG